MISQKENSPVRPWFNMLSRRLFGSLLIAGLMWSASRCLADPRVLVFSYSGFTNVPPQATNAIMLAPGLEQLGVLRADGTPVFWSDRTIVMRTNLLAISLGYYDEYCRIQPDGRVFGGYEGSDYGRLFDTGVSNAVAITGHVPYVILRDDGAVTLTPTNNLPWSNIVAIAAITVASPFSKSYVDGLKSDGTVVSWNDPFPVPPSLSNVVAIAAGNARLALKRDGTVTAWGDGAETNVPPGLSNIVAIAAYSEQGLALRQDGTVVSWGGTQVPPTLSNVVAIAVGPQCMVIVDPSPPPLLISSAGVTNGLFQVTVPTISGRVYCLEYAAALPATNWTPLPLVAGNGRMRVLADSTAVTGTGQRFYRVRKW